MVDSPLRHHVYCDESSMECRFMVYGGIITPEDNVAEFDGLLAEWRAKNRMNAELKWAKVSKSKLSEYISFVDFFFDHAAENHWHFKSVVFDTSQINYATHHEGDEELGFYKFYYHFLLHKFAPYAKNDDHRLWVYIDQKSTTKERLGALKDALNNGIRKKFSRSVSVIRAVEPRVSHECNLIQLADVLMGAIAYHCNGCHKADNAAQHRCKMVEHIATRAKLRNLAQSTPRGKSDFEIWRFKFSS